MTTLRIGQVAKAVGLSVETIRYYEQRGLLPQPGRSESGYRIYTERSIQVLVFICRSKGLGFSLQEIKELLDLQRMPEADSATVKGLVEDKIQLINAKLAELSELKQNLSTLSSLCDGVGPAEQCPILDFLSTGTEAGACHHK
ncbi:MAG: heavy metal-responsive transcriptional regulator [Motiliproteus sp.]|nr:heavy metal-responsive transcriptional regulator [Motiliproteus sp.]MCW9051334.1 heavy metal-responsive transcriptional regulator [Motiliproteus sp.]